MRVTSRQTGAAVEATPERARALVASGLFAEPAPKARPRDGGKARAAAGKGAGAAR